MCAATTTDTKAGYGRQGQTGRGRTGQGQAGIGTVLTALRALASNRTGFGSDRLPIELEEGGGRGKKEEKRVKRDCIDEAWRCPSS